MDEENESVKQGAARFWSPADKFVVGTTDGNNWKKLEILTDIHICSVDTKHPSDGRSDIDDLFEMVGPFCAPDGTVKPKAGLPMKYGPMKGGGPE